MTSAQSTQRESEDGIPWVVWLIPICSVLLWFVAQHHLAKMGNVESGLSERTVEEVYNDNIAVSLSSGNGYELDFQNNEWVNRYSEENAHGKFDWLFGAVGVGKTTRVAPRVSSHRFRRLLSQWQQQFDQNH